MMLLKLRFALLTGSTPCFLLGLTCTVLAQSTPPSGVTLPPGTAPRVEETIPRPPSPIPEQPPQPTPSPALQSPSTPVVPPETPTIPAKFRVDRIEVLGSTVLQVEITRLIRESNVEGNEVTFDDLINLRSAITKLYIDNGYITSGAFIPNNQRLDQGVIKIQVVEGRLEKIEINGLTRLRQSYVRSRLSLAGGTPINQQQLEQGLQLLQLDPLFTRVNAELTAGSAPGFSILRVQLQEASPFNASLGIANNQPPSVGSIQGSVFTSYSNLTGFGDVVTFEYGRTEGLNRYDVGYTLPFNARNGTFNFRYNNNDSKIIQNVFRELGIRSESETLSFSVRQPLHRTPNNELAVGIGLDVRRSQTFILNDIPFSFSEGPENGRSKVAVIRLFQDWVDRSATRVLAARSQFSIGVDAFGATVNNSGIDGRFFSWLGQFQWVQQVSNRVLMVARVDAQFTPDALLPLEQFSLGGVDTVRGYQQNQLVSDNGFLFSLEFRIPITRDPQILQLTPFIDVGTGWNNRAANPDPAVIAGTGLGINWRPIPELTLQLDYGIPLVSLRDRGGSLQGNGFYFSLRYQPF